MATQNGDTVQSTDPMQLLPSELVLRILEFTSPTGLAALTRLNKAWHAFIDETHQEAIYSHPSKTDHPPGAKDLSFVSGYKTYSLYFSNVDSWKELSKRQTLLQRNWLSERPETNETLVGVRNGAAWRFRPDFKRRFFLNTSQMGGLDVTDMDSGELLFRLDADTVRPFAHLEYQDGTAVWDREGDALDVWRADLEGAERGEFRRIAVLPHDRQTRGFQLSYDTLCVVSSQSRGYVYDMPGTPELKTTIEIEEGAVGHLDQCEDAVVYSIGSMGYHFYDKASGRFLGVLDPQNCRDRFHVDHPPRADEGLFGYNGAAADDASNVMIPRQSRYGQITPLEIGSGPLEREDGDGLTLEEDEWGAGMIDGNLMVGVSRGGRIFVCSDWRLALQNTSSMRDHSAVIECDGDGSTFDLGGWLSIRDHRILCEIKEKVYVLGLTDENKVASTSDKTARPSFAFGTSLASLFGAPVSFMAFYDDCIMTTYTTLRYVEEPAPQIFGHQQPVTRALPTKAIRIMSLAPKLDDESEDQGSSEDEEGRLRRQERVMHNVGSSELIAMLIGAENATTVSDTEEEEPVDDVEETEGGELE